MGRVMMNILNTQNFCQVEPANFSINDNCLMTMQCLLRFPTSDDGSIRRQCEKVCPNQICPKSNCPSLYKFPSFPVLYGHVRFVFMNKERELFPRETPLPDYVCYDEKRCSDFLPPTIDIMNLRCRQLSELDLKNGTRYEKIYKFIQDLKNIFRMCLITLNEIHSCNHSTMYQCSNSSKCISKHRLMDGIQDCPFNDDETYNNSCSLSDAQYRVRCSANGKIKCFAPFTFLNSKSDCEYGEDERTAEQLLIETHIYFQTICDGTQELAPVLIDGQNETDETECQHWSCNNTYTRCDGYWQCPNGTDELYCSPTICPKLHHKCVFPNDTSNSILFAYNTI